jgi:hypothetical protein
MEGLTEGRSVHYVTSTGKHLAATVSEVSIRETGSVTLHVLDPAGVPSSNIAPVTVLNHVPYSDKFELFTWHWIERA